MGGETVTRDTSEQVWAKRLVAPPFALSWWCDSSARRRSRTLTRQVCVAWLMSMGCGGCTGRRPGLLPLAVGA